MKRESKRLKEKKLNKKIFNAFIIIFIIVVLIGINYNNIFGITQTKNITYKLGEYELKNMSQEIMDGNVKLPYPKELGIETRVGETFLGYDINNDGQVDYQAGDLMQVKSNNSELEVQAITSEDNIPFTAWLYDDGSYTTGTELTTGTTDITTPWNQDSTVRYLIIDLNLAQGIGGTVEITLPVGMYLYGNDGHTGVGGDITDVSFETLSGLEGTGGQGVGTYINTKTGTLTYTFSELATSGNQIIVPVAYDINIWDRTTLTNTNFTNGLPPITVTMTEGTSVYAKTLDDVVFGKKYLDLGLQLVRWYSPTRVLLDTTQSMYREELRQTAGYWEEFIIEYTLPSKDGDYATYVGENTASTANRFPEGLTIDTSDPTKVVYTWTNFYHRTGYVYVAPNLMFSSELFSADETLTSHVKIILTSYGGHTLEREESKSIKISAGAEIVYMSVVEYLYNDLPDTIESHLGHLSINNAGLAASDKIEMKYTFDSRNTANTRNMIDVSAVSLPQTMNQTFNVTYSLIDKYNNYVAQNQQIEITSGTTNTSGGIITIPMVVEKYNLENPSNQLNVDEVFFKNIDYEIQSVPANTTLYVGSAMLNNLASGNFYGQYNGSYMEYAFSQFECIEYNADGSIKKSGIRETNLRGTPNNSNSIYFRAISVDNPNPNAGEEISVVASVNNHYYPYGNSQYIKTPVVYFLAPKGIEIVPDTVTVTRDTEQFTFELRQREVGTSGQVLYTIYVTDPNASFGGSYFDENGVLKGSNAYSDLKVNMKLVSDPASSYLSERLSNMFFVKDLAANNSIHSAYVTQEPYDFENDGTLGNVVKTTSTASITIYPNTNQVEFINELNINERGYTSDELSYILSDSLGNIDSGIAGYRLKLQNNSEGLIAGEDFYYYMPVPKAGVIYPNEMNIVNSLIDFELTSEPKVSGDNGLIYDVKYTTKTDLVDTSGNLNLVESDWKTLTEIDSFADVTMVKITGLPRTIIQSHTEDIITLNLKYEVKAGYVSNGYDSGKTISFNSYGWQKYLEGGLENTENIYTISNSVSSMLRYVTEYNEQILASYIPSDDKTVTFTLPSYFENKEMNVLSVKEYNVDLVPKTEIDANQNLVDTNITDRNFSITAKLGTGTTHELSSYIDTPIYLGGITKDTSETILFEIASYENMADEASTKYVDVVLGDDQGIRYTLRLNISRNVKHITEPVTAIAEGMLYKLIDNGKTEITITRDSSMTMQYDFTYVPADHDNVKLEFSTNLPIGTKIRMIDSSDLLVNDEGDYIFSTSYYYYETTAEVPNILLSEFQDMRTQENFDIGTDLRNERTIYTFIIEFETNYLPVGNYTASIVPIQTGGTEYTSFDLSFILTEKREFDIETTNTDYVIKDDKVDVLVNFNSSQITGIDTKYRNEVLALRIRFNQDIPIGSYIEIQDKIYLLEESDFILNYGNYFLIPLGNIEDIENIQYTLHSPMDNYVAGSIYHEIVYLEEPQGASYADVTSSFTVVDPPPPAMRLTVNNGNELILVENISQVPLTFDYIDYDDTTTFTTRLYIMEKSEGAYLRQTELLESVIIDNKIITPTKGIAILNLENLGPTVEIVLNLNEALININGTYRIVMETNHLGEVKYEDLVNFIVIDKE